MIEAAIQRDFILNAACMVQSYAFLGSGWKDRACVQNIDVRCRRSPALIHEWYTARRKARRPDSFDRVRTLLIIQASGCDCEKVVVNNIQVIARREAVCWRENIGFAPTHELFPDFERNRPVVVRSAQAPDCQRRPLCFTIPP